MKRLRDYGLTPQHIMETNEEDLKKLIYPVGFYVRKSGYIKRTTAILLKDYDGDIPDTIEGLVKLPGVGPKMGYLTLQVAWKKMDGIGIDVHHAPHLQPSPLGEHQNAGGNEGGSGVVAPQGVLAGDQPADRGIWPADLRKQAKVQGV